MMEKHYDAKASEAKWYKKWEEGGCFHDEPGCGEPYSVVIPPPNVTGILHMGHALNQTIQDILVRWRRMQPEPGCRFAARCPHAKDVCRSENPAYEEIEPDHFVACHFCREINAL